MTDTSSAPALSTKVIAGSMEVNGLKAGRSRAINEEETTIVREPARSLQAQEWWQLEGFTSS